MIDRNAKQVSVTGGRGPGEVSELVVEFITPGAGMFGRDKAVPLSESTSAKASYVKDGQRDTVAATARLQAVTLPERCRGTVYLTRGETAHPNHHGRVTCATSTGTWPWP